MIKRLLCLIFGHAWRFYPLRHDRYILDAGAPMKCERCEKVTD